MEIVTGGWEIEALQCILPGAGAFVLVPRFSLPVSGGLSIVVNLMIYGLVDARTDQAG